MAIIVIGDANDEADRDRALVRARAADADHLLVELVRRYRTPLVRFFERRIDVASDAEEMAQEVFYRLARKPDFSAAQANEGFLFEVAANLLRDRARRAQSRSTADHVAIDTVEIVSEAPSVERQLEGKRRFRVLLSALEELTPKCRTVFLLHRYEEMPQSEIAKRMGISVSAVEKHMINALARLRQAMTADGAANANDEGEG